MLRNNLTVNQYNRLPDRLSILISNLDQGWKDCHHGGVISRPVVVPIEFPHAGLREEKITNASAALEDLGQVFRPLVTTATTATVRVGIQDLIESLQGVFDVPLTGVGE